MSDNISGKVVVIVGGNSGIGAAAAKYLAQRGAKVMIAGRRQDKLEEIRNEIASNGGVVEARSIDITQKQQADHLIAETISVFGRVDVIVNCAGVMYIRPVAEVNTQEWDQMIDLNIKGTLYGVAAVLPHFQQNDSGHIINISSIAGIKVFAPGGTVYSGTKFAINAISDGIRQEIGSKIRVTVIEPGAVESELKLATSGTAKEAVMEFYKNAIPSDSVARAIGFAIEQPAEVDINTVALRPTSQEF